MEAYVLRMERARSVHIPLISRIKSARECAGAASLSQAARHGDPAEIIEAFVPGHSSPSELRNLLSLCGALVEDLELRQLLPPLDVSLFCGALVSFLFRTV